MSETLQAVLVTLSIMVPVEYTAVAFSSFVSKIVVVKFLRSLGDAARSRETKQEAAAAAKAVQASYKMSLVWPLEIFKTLREKR
jgi:hypothetical protein